MFRLWMDSIMGFYLFIWICMGIYFYKLGYFYAKVRRDTSAVISLFPNYIYFYDDV